MKIGLKTCMPLIAASTILSNSCKHSYASTLADHHDEPAPASIIQAKLDSMAYRNIFNSTFAAKDSVFVEEFNTIANDMKSSYNEIDMILSDNGITPEEYTVQPLMNDTTDSDPRYQFFADKWMFKKFFEKIGIMNDSVQKRFEEVSKQIDPN